MRGEAAMIRTVLVGTLCGLAWGSIEHDQGAIPVFPAPGVPLPAPVVAATSSQYFERTFNRLVAPPAIQPVVPIVPQIVPQQPVFVQPTPNVVPVSPTPASSGPVQPNVAIAVATANFAAPVATILLPPYPFGQPPTIGFVPPSTPINVPDDTKEATTQTTTQVEVKTTRQPEATTPVPASSNNNFNVQALPSNQNENQFNQAYGPPPLPEYPKQLIPQLPPLKKPQKFKTSVEIVSVPLTYIAPPPLKYQAVKTVKHVHTFIPLKSKVIIRPAHSHLKLHARRPVKLVYKVPVVDRVGQPLNLRGPVPREVEPTTFRPSARPVTKPPRL